ncbi:S-adenosyl-L-methionine-dependent methyltransferase [Lepidopterella palustris CBS 459.81]|uniref:S-adenosyl-L-methionine-dependent methyltransferase n=1 Tax=Lepidopterella palustris CBS 459.81 TaxID=1314670 RepID=A0A8E2EJP6_9PEZI|nr:S-adenosyl-L-methionine-dependent methyltransferase [Lepidopterella palustris CBS 459.81]
MSLYYEAASILTNADKAGGSLKSRIFNKKDLKSTPAQLFALVTEVSKWSAVLKEVVERSGVLKEERKLTPILALLLSHDLLLSKGGIAAPANHVLKLAITRHKARLSAEFTKARLKQGFSTLEAFREHINTGSDGSEDTAAPSNRAQAVSIQHPRWVRINTLRTTLQQQLDTTFAGYSYTDDLSKITSASNKAEILYQDPHIPSLLALPPRADLSKHPAYVSGQLIFQDKASCFPAYLLDANTEDADVIDACAAPGNKTTHLTAILSECRKRAARGGRVQRVIAFEKDKQRATTLNKMVKLAGADDMVTVKGGQDFLAVDPESEEMVRVGALLLDPSCSGSGIVGRDDSAKLFLPDPNTVKEITSSSHKSKKRKRRAPAIPALTKTAALEPEEQDTALENMQDDSTLNDRLSALSTFQLRLLTHAMRFPAARKITYSTCSLYFEENESVVLRALVSPIAKGRGWRILKRGEQVEGLRRWEKRGIWEDGKLGEEDMLEKEEKKDVLEGCIRCEKGTKEGTMGFFVAGFVRDGVRDDVGGDNGLYKKRDAEGDEADDWLGFSDNEVGEPNQELNEIGGNPAPPTIQHKKEKKNRKKRKA